MKKENSFTKFILLFLTFMKIGATTFGGGYAMIPIIQREVSEKRNWIKPTEILDILAISESTPGPIAINAATYIGFKVAGFWGSVFSTLGLVFPSFVIIYLISLFYKDFMTWHWVYAAFKGLKIGVILLLTNAFLKLKKGLKLNIVTYILFFAILISNLALALIPFDIPFFSLFCIILGFVVGIISESLVRRKE